MRIHMSGGGIWIDTDERTRCNVNSHSASRTQLQIYDKESNDELLLAVDTAQLAKWAKKILDACELDAAVDSRPQTPEFERRNTQGGGA